MIVITGGNLVQLPIIITHPHAVIFIFLTKNTGAPR